MVARDLHRIGDVGEAAATRDQRRPLVDQAVMDPPRLLVARIARLEDLPGESLGQLADRVGQRYAEIIARSLFIEPALPGLPRKPAAFYQPAGEE